nr:MAG TPA: hypothetical protein [Caudoviricetes sp.]
MYRISVKKHPKGCFLLCPKREDRKSTGRTLMYGGRR